MEEPKENPFEFGKFLSSPSLGDEVIISGISGRYPKADNVDQLRHHLLNKIDMVREPKYRYGDFKHPELPARVGTMLSIEQFDPGYFGIYRQEAEVMDPMARMFLEVAVEAVMDAGLNPAELAGTRTGVFVGACNSECARLSEKLHLQPGRRTLTGILRSIIANRVSYYLKLNGPSFTCDTACSSSLFALEEAYKAMRRGDVDYAIVGGTGILINGNTTVQFTRLGVLSQDGSCKCFDEDGNGYVRAEAISAIFLQKARDAKRIYATVVHAKTNCDGYKEHGITFPSSEMQTRLFKEFYQECPVKPSELGFIEAHGTGTKVGDPEEFRAIESVFLEGRTKPLLIGSVKSNLGHTEATSGLCSIAKAVIAYETGVIAPNLNFQRPRKGLAALEDGRIAVVARNTPLQDDRGLIGVNSFGFGGGNCHVLLRWNERGRTYAPQAGRNVPRLVCASGRTEEAVGELLESVAGNKFDAEYVRLVQEVFKNDVNGHWYRGYIMESLNYGIQKRVTLLQNKKLYLAFGEINNTLIQLFEHLVDIPLLKRLVSRIQDILSVRDIQLTKSNNQKLENDNKLLKGFVTQILLGKLIQELEIRPFSLVANSSGHLAAAYFEGVLNLEDVLDIVCQMEKCVENGDNDDSIEDQLIHKRQVVIHLERILSKKRKIGDSLPGKKTEEFVQRVLERPTGQSLRNLKDKVVVFEIGELENVKESNKLKLISLSDKETNLADLFHVFGKLYTFGINPKIHKLYPEVQFPVRRGTPMISPSIKWNHSRKYLIPNCRNDLNNKNTVSFVIRTEEGNGEWAFAAGHIINGRNLFPATGYIFLVWKTMADVKNIDPDILNIVFENVRFRRSCILPKGKDSLELSVMVERGSGNFEVVQDGVPVVTGRVYFADGVEDEQLPIGTVTQFDKGVKMNTRDIYKELRLRGYDYRGIFRSLTECNQTFTAAKIKWQNNWVAFMDNMLQIKILKEDTRQLYVPTFISRLTVAGPSHLCYLEKFEDKNIPLYVDHNSGIIGSGFIQIHGLMALTIPKKRPLGIPVLEKYKFVPNEGSLNLQEAVRVQMQIVLENALVLRMKIIELVDEFTVEKGDLLAPVIKEVLGDQPLIQPDITIFSAGEIEGIDVKVEDGKLKSEFDCILIAGSKLFQRPSILQQAFTSLAADGFILSRENLNFDHSSKLPEDISIVNVHQTTTEKLVLFKKTSQTKTTAYVNVSTIDSDFQWLPVLKEQVKKNDSVVVYVEKEPLSGIVGLVNCIRREPKCQHVRCVFVVDEDAPPFDPQHEFYRKELSKNLAVNVFKDGSWGTYRHLLLDPPAEIDSEHCYGYHTVRGDLSSIKWVKGRLTPKMKPPPETELVHIYYSSLNFRDVMLASGKISTEMIDRRQEEVVQGFEYSGRRADGRRVMGMGECGALSNMMLGDSCFMYDVPDEWSLQDAATVPLVYSTVLYALITTANIRPNDSILIHCGAGGIGQAAIHVSRVFGCKIFTTVGTQEKREFIKKHFPEITDRQIGNSRDTSFERLVMKETGGRGVDIVLNSLAEEKLVASVRCLARGGRFLEIGKYDFMNNNGLRLRLLRREASFHGVMLDKFFSATPAFKQRLVALTNAALRNGWVKPLHRAVFAKDELEEAFRFMAQGKHIGKVVVEMRREEEQRVVEPSELILKGVPRYLCDPEKSYIICGGLGGFGLELADWLILRGATKLVLTSRTGIQAGYQQYRINIWKNYGCQILVSTQDITTKEGCEKLIREATTLGPVHSIFNLAVILEDSILENQTIEKFQISFGPKVYATQHLDEVSRVMCPELRDFVVFSSVSCGRGNAGQTNYGMANSVMERICEKRQNDGLPALAIEWGAVGDVGLVAKMQEEHSQLEIGGTLQQGITSCLEVLDTFLNTRNEAVVGSMVVAIKKNTGMANNAVEAVANILGIADLKSVSIHTSLAELGMDSMTAVEIKQTLERDFDIILPDEKIRSITLAQIKEIEDERNADDSPDTPSTAAEPAQKANMLLSLVLPDETTADVPLFERFRGEGMPQVVAFPGVEGAPKVIAQLADRLDANVTCLQYCNGDQTESLPETAKKMLRHLEEHLSKEEPFYFVSHSYGTLVALEVAHHLEQKGYLGTIVCLDGAPEFFKSFSEAYFKGRYSGREFETAIVAHIMSIAVTYNFIDLHLEKIYNCETFDERVQMAVDLDTEKKHEPQFLKDCAISSIKRINSVLKYQPDFKLKSNVILYKPTAPSFEYKEEDYGLSRFCTKPVEIKIFEGDHVSILNNEDLINEINENLKEYAGLR